MYQNLTIIFLRLMSLYMLISVLLDIRLVISILDAFLSASSVVPSDGTSGTWKIMTLFFVFQVLAALVLWFKARFIAGKVCAGISDPATKIPLEICENLYYVAIAVCGFFLMFFVVESAVYVLEDIYFFLMHGQEVSNVSDIFVFAVQFLFALFLIVKPKAIWRGISKLRRA